MGGGLRGATNPPLSARSGASERGPTWRDGRPLFVAEAPGGAPAPGSLDAPETLSMDEHEFVWIGLADPTDDELAILQTKFDLHPLAVEDAQHAHQMPKVDVYGNQMFVVTRTAHLEDGRIAYGETAIFVGPRFIISARHGSTRGHIELRHQLEAAPALLQHGVDYVLHAILDFIVDGYTPVVEAIEDEVLEMERRALDTFLGRAEVTRIFTVRRDLMKFRRVLGPMEEMAGRLTHLDFPCLDAEVKPYFRDVLDHVRRVQSRVGGLGEVLTSVFEVSGLLETQRQSAITRKLAAWAAIE